MIWRFEPKREPDAGFTLLESLLAIVLAALILGSVYSSTSRALKMQADAVAKHEMKLVARAVMDEYLVTYPSTDRPSALGDLWSWTITERAINPEQPSPDDKFFDYFKVAVTVSASSMDLDTVTLESRIRRIRRDR